MVQWDGTLALTTPRLRLRTFRRDDLPHYAAVNADPEVARYLGGPLSREHSDDIAEWGQPGVRGGRHRPARGRAPRRRRVPRHVRPAPSTVLPRRRRSGMAARP
ncbi:MAG: GNAT family N-acetyltransferase [Actinomycetota bacterium]